MQALVKLMDVRSAIGLIQCSPVCPRCEYDGDNDELIADVGTAIDQLDGLFAELCPQDAAGCPLLVHNDDGPQCAYDGKHCSHTED